MAQGHNACLSSCQIRSPSSSFVREHGSCLAGIPSVRTWPDRCIVSCAITSSWTNL